MLAGTGAGSSLVYTDPPLTRWCAVEYHHDIKLPRSVIREPRTRRDCEHRKLKSSYYMHAVAETTAENSDQSQLNHRLGRAIKPQNHAVNKPVAGEQWPEGRGYGKWPGQEGFPVHQRYPGHACGAMLAPVTKP